MPTTSTRLEMKFNTMSGVKTWSFKYADPDVETSKINHLAQAMIANGSIYADPPLSLDSAQYVETKITTIDVSAAKQAARQAAIDIIEKDSLRSRSLR